MCTRTVILDTPSTVQGPPTLAGKSSRHRPPGSRLDADRNPETVTLSLPQDSIIKISVLTGLSQGTECQLSRPLMTIGRRGGGADIEIDDSEVSRLHCAVEARHDAIFLRDLHSTNGTYLDNSLVFAARLEHMSQFRIGSSVLQVTVHAKP
jgi:pSer/pThr/pTyr-binding forkhead associated (FHA) protein